MKRKPSKAKKRRTAVQIWTYSQARNLVPYLKSVVASLREHKLTEQKQGLTAKRLSERPGRPDRESIIALEDAKKAIDEAGDAVDACLEELGILDVYCLDPVAGQVLVPTTHDDELAWFVYDQFDKEPIRFWRLHTDPLETRRPLTEMKRSPKEPTWTA